MLPSRTLQQDCIPGAHGGNWLLSLLCLTSPLPCYIYFFSGITSQINIYTGILVSGSPFGEPKPRYHPLGIVIFWLTKDYSQMRRDVPFLKVQNRHLKVLLAFHCSHDHSESQGQLGNVVQPYARILVNMTNLSCKGD